jgi:WD40 repeat protein
VVGLAFSPDGAVLASVTGITTHLVSVEVMLGSEAVLPQVVVSDAATGRQLSAFADESRLALKAAFSSGGKLLAFGAADGAVHLWDVAAGKLLRSFKGHRRPVYSTAFSPDGKTLASGSADGTVVLWDVATGRARRTLEGHDSWVSSLAFSPDGKTLAAGTSEQAVVLWDVGTGERLQALEMAGNRVSRVTFSPDGRLLAAASPDGRVVLWNTLTGAPQAQLYTRISAGAIAFSPDSSLLAVSRRGRVLLWSVREEGQVHELAGHDRKGYGSIAFAPDGRTVAAGGSDGSVTLWQMAPSTESCQVRLVSSRLGGAPPAVPRPSPSPVPSTRPVPLPTSTSAGGDALDAWEFGSLVYALYSPSGEHLIWLLAGEQPPRRLPRGSFPRLSPDGCSLLYSRSTYSRQTGSEYVVLDVPMAAERFVFSSYELWNTGVYDIAWSPDSIHLALTLGGYVKRYYSGNLWLLDTSDGTTTRVASRGGGEPLFSPDGKWIATSTPEIGYSHGSVGLWGAEGQGGRGLFDPIWSHSKRWAADSSGFSLALTRIGIEGSDLYWVPVDGEPVQIGHLPVEKVAWLRGGKQYTYYTDRLRRANWDGSEDVEVPGLEGKKGGQWSPDARRLFARDEAGSAYIVDAHGLDAPVRLSVGRLHNWLDETHYLASTTTDGSTSLYACALPESCRLLARIDGPISTMQYVPQRCTRTHDIRVLPSPTPEENDIPVLIETILNDPDKGARSEATVRLGRIAPPEIVVPVLIQSIQQDPGMRWISCEVLHGIGPAAMEAVPALIEALADRCSTDYEPSCQIEQGGLIRTLRAIMGQDFGEDAEAWHGWWKTQQ